MSKPSFNDNELALASNYANAFDLWADMSNQDTGTLVDHMEYTLTALGYTGTLVDKYNSWLADEAGDLGTPMDNYKYICDYRRRTIEEVVYDDDANVVWDDADTIVYVSV